MATIRLAIGLGCTLLDTAEVCGPYTNEDLLGRALREIGAPRGQVVIATKFGFKIENGGKAGTDSRPEHVREAVAGSLRRLRTDYTKRRAYLGENIAAADVTLMAEEVAALDATLAPGTVPGPRYNERFMAYVDR